ncbi:MAG: patatin-like phospholipase family protein [Acholeplasma sp.]
MAKKIKVGLMLGGGGAKGSYQLGVIKALEELNLMKHIDAISGVSIGAINALLLMSKKKYSDMVSIWEIMDTDNVFGTKGQSFRKEKRLYNFVPVAEKLIQNVDLKLVRKSKYDGFATAALIYDKQSFIHQIKTDTMEKAVFHLNKVKDPYLATMASASIPVVFGPTTIDGKNYVDGGLIDNYPIQPLIDNGCNLIIAVALDDWFNPYIYDNQDVNIINFTSNSAFEKSRLADMLDVMKFHSGFKTEKEELGYYVAKTMIQKMINERYIKRSFGFTHFVKKEGFHVLELSKFDEMFIKNMKIKSRMKIRKMIKENKRQKKLEGKVRG